TDLTERASRSGSPDGSTPSASVADRDRRLGSRARPSPPDRHHRLAQPEGGQPEVAQLGPFHVRADGGDVRGELAALGEVLQNLVAAAIMKRPQLERVALRGGAA